jgi:hypothetical protein
MICGVGLATKAKRLYSGGVQDRKLFMKSRNKVPARISLM